MAAYRWHYDCKNAPGIALARLLAHGRRSALTPTPLPAPTAHSSDARARGRLRLRGWRARYEPRSQAVAGSRSAPAHAHQASSGGKMWTCGRAALLRFDRQTIRVPIIWTGPPAADALLPECLCAGLGGDAARSACTGPAQAGGSPLERAVAAGARSRRFLHQRGLVSQTLELPLTVLATRITRREEEKEEEKEEWKLKAGAGVYIVIRSRTNTKRCTKSQVENRKTKIFLDCQFSLSMRRGCASWLAFFLFFSFFLFFLSSFFSFFLSLFVLSSVSASCVRMMM